MQRVGFIWKKQQAVIPESVLYFRNAHAMLLTFLPVAFIPVKTD